jgi:hypothetical protein
VESKVEVAHDTGGKAIRRGQNQDETKQAKEIVH